MLSACALNEYGLVKVSRFENASSQAIELKSCGLHLITAHVESSLTIGCSKRIYVYSKKLDKDVVDVTGESDFLVENSSQMLSPVERYLEQQTLADFGEARLFSSDIKGIYFGRNPIGLRFIVGHNALNTLSVPSDGDRLFFIKFNPSDIEGSEVLFKEFAK